jgi:alpha-tubulin suppressor-like RCC1 family protein
MAIRGPVTGITFKNTQTGVVTDLGGYYVSNDYLLDVYPNLVPGRSSPGLYGWGGNQYGQLGNSSSNAYSSPIQVGSLSNWRQVACGYNYSHAIKTDGTLWSWGQNTVGQLGQNNLTIRSSPIQVGSLTDWRQVACGYQHSVAVKTDGTLWSWGWNSSGQLGINNRTNTSNPTQVGTLTNWKKSACGNSYSVAIKTDGTLWSWGVNSYGQLGDATQLAKSSPVQVGTLTTWRDVACGYGTTYAIKTDGTLWTWGYNIYGALGNNTVNVHYSSPIQVGALTNWKSVSSNYTSVMAIKTDGTLWAWGNNDYGQLGIGNTARYSSPVQVGALTNWKSLPTRFATLGEFSMAIKTDGTLWAWGNNSSGELGLNDRTGRSSPVQVGSLNNWKQIACGYYGFTVSIADGYI